MITMEAANNIAAKTLINEYGRDYLAARIARLSYGVHLNESPYVFKITFSMDHEDYKMPQVITPGGGLCVDDTVMPQHLLTVSVNRRTGEVTKTR